MAKRTDDDDFSFFDLNEYELDTEWMQQPKLMFRWSRKLANAEQTLDECKAQFDITCAELDRDIRSDPEHYLGKIRFSEGALTAAMKLQDEYTAAREEVQAAQHRVKVLKAVVSALDHRKAALENRVRLHGQGYFSACKGDDEGTKELARRTESNFRGVGSKQKKKHKED